MDNKPKYTYDLDSDDSVLFSVMGVIFAFLFSVLGILFSVLGIIKSKKRKNKINPLSIVGLILSIIITLFSVVAIYVYKDQIPVYINTAKEEIVAFCTETTVNETINMTNNTDINKSETQLAIDVALPSETRENINSTEIQTQFLEQLLSQNDLEKINKDISLNNNYTNCKISVIENNLFIETTTKNKLPDKELNEFKNTLKKESKNFEVNMKSIISNLENTYKINGVTITSIFYNSDGTEIWRTIY